MASGRDLVERHPPLNALNDLCASRLLGTTIQWRQGRDSSNGANLTLTTRGAGRDSSTGANLTRRPLVRNLKTHEHWSIDAYVDDARRTDANFSLQGED
jgi:hypothetical protein